MLKFILLYIFSLTFHPVHVSMSSMEYNPGDGGFSITVRMYSDDLLLDLLSLYELTDNHITDHIYTGPEDVYQDYINDRMKIVINGQQHKARLVESEKLEIETVMRLFVRCSDEIQTVNISNNILTGIYADQVNLFIYKDDGNELAFRFNGTYSGEELKLNKQD